MNYINTQTGAYPLSVADIRAAHKNTSFPAGAAAFDQCLADFGYAAVSKTPRPFVDYTKNVSEESPVKTDAGYEQAWLVQDATAAEIALRTSKQALNVREDRNQLLTDSDWTQLADSPLDADAKLAWALYRESLRLIPQQTGFPWNVQWPSEPGTN